MDGWYSCYEDLSLYGIGVILCQVCGNKIVSGARLCRYCGSKQGDEGSVASKGIREFRHKVVNLEMGRPLVETALKKMSLEIELSRSEQVQVMTLIHGYGSSGKGGVIRQECRKTLDYMCSKGLIDSFIPGEKFSRKSGPTRALLRRYPQLANDKNINRSNPGITLVII